MQSFRSGPLAAFVLSLPFLAAVGCGASPKHEAADPSSEDHGSGGGGGGKSGPAEVGHPAPDLSIQTVNGKGKIAIDGLAGKIVLVDFWATWCEPCKKSFPALQEIAKRHPGDVQVVGVSVNDESDGIADFAKELGTTFPIGWDEGHTIAERWKVPSMPSSFIVDGTGTVRFVHAGYHMGDEAEIEKQIMSLMNGKSAPAEKADKPADKPAVSDAPADPPADAAEPAPPPPPKPAVKPKGGKKKKKKKPAPAATH